MMTDRTVTFALLSLAIPLLTVAPVEGIAGARSLPQHPRLLFNEEGIKQLKERIDKYDWAREQWESTLKQAEEVVKTELLLPPRGGNWTHWYACPEHGAPLKRGEQIGQWQWKHICSVGGEELPSDPAKSSTDFDACLISGIHDRNSKAVRDLGIAYRITGESRFAAKAREIMLAYADRYASYPLHNVQGEEKIGGGKISAQTLNEATWLIPVCQGADLVWDTLSDEDRAKIAQELLLPAVKDVIIPHKMGIHNIQCWKNSAVGLVGLLLGDSELIDEAIDNPESGFRMQMQKGVMPDGSWWEGAWGYHFYTLSALWPLAEAARNCGIDLYDNRLRAMYLAPLKFAMPNLRLPAFSDSAEVNLASQAATYELAYARYNDQAFLPLIADADRRSEFALWFGAHDLPPVPERTYSSTNHPESGFGILARGKGEDATWLCLKYGPHGGGHGHPDKLGFVLCARGEVIGLDPGTVRYGLPSYRGWYRTTIAHSTLTVNEQSQDATDGKCLAFGSTGGVDYVVADAGKIYAGVKFVRAIALLNDDCILYVDLVGSDEAKTLDLAYHQRGKWSELPKGQPWNIPNKPGYSYLQDAESRQVSGPMNLEIDVRDDWKTVITCVPDTPAEMITATGVGLHNQDRVPVAILRKNGKGACVVWSVALDGKAPRIERLSIVDADGKPIAASSAAAINITTSDGITRSIAVNPDKLKLNVSLPDGKKWQVESVLEIR